MNSRPHRALICFLLPMALAWRSPETRPGILLEITDNPDPVTIGGTTTYSIGVVNQESAELTHIRVRCTLEDSMSFVSSDGPTSAKATGLDVVFEAMERIEPRGRATWKVVVRALKAADARFKASLTSDQIRQPVEKTESTRFVQGKP